LGDAVVSLVVSGSGAVSGTAKLEGSNDGRDWVDIGEIVVSGTTEAEGKRLVFEPWAFIRASITAISGTNALAVVVQTSNEFDTTSRAIVSACVAKNTGATVAIPNTPTPVVFSAVSTVDSKFNLANGVITFDDDYQFTSVFAPHVRATSGTPLYYADAEVSTDGGTTWVRGVDSARESQLRNTDGVQTLSLPFSGRFAKGVKLRFVHWASTASVEATTTTNNGSTAPAIRLTYSATRAVFE
ncbi:hypothetical protein, partial [Plesiomonas sp.]|uniref:hypothetical protein n=1 Tax=Plesiomonas sp. TaxID=2486279 RepID=UPI003F2BFEEE